MVSFCSATQIHEQPLFCLGQSLLDGKHFQIFAEQQLLTTTESFIHALALLMCTYFNFNMLYPVEAAATCDFIQRYLFVHLFVYKMGLNEYYLGIELS
jgi:hypothetical protein